MREAARIEGPARGRVKKKMAAKLAVEKDLQFLNKDPALGYAI